MLFLYRHHLESPFSRHWIHHFVVLLTCHAADVRHHIPKCSSGGAGTARVRLLLSANKKAPSLSERKGSFVGHWSESYCLRGRQIGSVKPHWQSDWNWFVVLLLQHPIKRRSLGRGREWGSALMVPVRHGGADGRHGRKWLLALGQLGNAQTSCGSRWNGLGWFEGQSGLGTPRGKDLWGFSVLKSGLISKRNINTPLFSVSELTVPGSHNVWWFYFWVWMVHLFGGTTCSPCWLAVKIMAVFPSPLLLLSAGRNACRV